MWGRNKMVDAIISERWLDYLRGSTRSSRRVDLIILTSKTVGLERQNYYFNEIGSYTRSVQKVSGLPLYLRTIVFERPLRGINVNNKASRTYRLLADICRTYSSCSVSLFTKLFMSSVDFVIVKNDWKTWSTNLHQILLSTQKNEFGNYSDDAEGLWE